jgi:peptidoglycan/LPS O-acetylase OafA/YrhL
MAQNEILLNKLAKRLPFIDLLRFIAAMMVATSHWGLEFGRERYQQIYDFPVLGDLVKNGGFGVNIFFAISGFVIFGAAQKYNSTDFLFARFNRLFPGLLISMLIVLPVGSYFISSYESPFDSFFNSLFLTYQLTGVEPLASPLWTLVIEIKFYVGVALVLLVFPRLFKSAKGISLLLASWELAIIILRETSLPISTFLLPYLSLNEYSDFFALGICCSLLSKTKYGFSQENLFVSLVSLYFINEIFLGHDYSSRLKIYLMISSIVIIFSQRFILSRKLQKLSYWLGLSSYLIYLLHTHLGMAFILQLQSRVTDNIYFIVGMGMVLITITCILLAIFIEIPAQKLLKKQYLRIRTNTHLR